ncbi:hypothetical protein [Propionibacterium acidifaciens]
MNGIVAAGGDHVGTPTADRSDEQVRRAVTTDADMRTDLCAIHVPKRSKKQKQGDEPATPLKNQGGFHGCINGRHGTGLFLVSWGVFGVVVDGAASDVCGGRADGLFGCLVLDGGGVALGGVPDVWSDIGFSDSG